VKNSTQLQIWVNNFLHFLLGCFAAVFFMARRRKSTPFKALLVDEALVCQRIGVIRRDAGLSQAEFAARIRTTRDQVASIEYKRVSLKWPLGLAICRAFDVSQLWLAKGTEPIHPFFNLDRAQDWNLIPDATPFSAVCNGPLSEQLALRHRLLAESAGATSGPAVASAFYSMVQKCVNDELAFLPDECRPAFLDGLPAALRSLMARVEQRSIHETDAKRSKLSVDILSGPAIFSGMSSGNAYWKSLAKRLGAVTAARGAKAQLAHELKVTRQAVNNWISENSAPSAELTLRLLNWVERAEAQQTKNPGSASTQPGPKTQVHNSSNEKQTQARKKG
jgi:transcriptional regulator with XRE-family HTH domain